MRIAIYGKGGIGKSTISANLSAAFSRNGKKVLQIGCDPKQDSTRLLLEGTPTSSILEYIQMVPPVDRRLDDVLHRGYCGVRCAEAGGPRPGVGCAGRGILTAFELLSELGLGRMEFDMTIYDVLGDVVCGGFAVPLRREYADAVFIVTSGEFMALYAANNILKGVRNYDDASSRVGGIILNCRGVENEDRLVSSFAREVGLPIVARIPRSPVFPKAEMKGRTVVELFPDFEEAKGFADLARYIDGISRGQGGLYPANPLDEEDMDLLISGRTGRRACPTRDREEAPPRTAPERTVRASIAAGRPWSDRFVWGCAFAGAVATTAQVTDAVTVVHGPASCASMIMHYMPSYGGRMARSSGGPDPVGQNIVHTGMGERSMIFGGVSDLEAAIKGAVAKGTRNVFVVTTCPSGIIGDDVGMIAERVEQACPGTTVAVVPSDGNMSGGFSKGITEACVAVSRFIDRSVNPEPDRVNIIGEKNLATNRDLNFGIIAGLLNGLGLRINCRFLSRTSMEEIRMFGRGGTCLPAEIDEATAEMASVLPLPGGMFPLPFPSGFRETCQWLTLLGERTGREKEAAGMISGMEGPYKRSIGELGRHLRGKRALVLPMVPRFDWAIDTMQDLGMEVAKVGIPPSKYEEEVTSRYADTVDIQHGYGEADWKSDLDIIRPDLVISQHIPFPAPGGLRHCLLPYAPDAGFDAGIVLARRWANIARLPAIEGWRTDGGGK